MINQSTYLKTRFCRLLREKNIYLQFEMSKLKILWKYIYALHIGCFIYSASAKRLQTKQTRFQEIDWRIWIINPGDFSRGALLPNFDQNFFYMPLISGFCPLYEIVISRCVQYTFSKHIYDCIFSKWTLVKCRGVKVKISYLNPIRQGKVVKVDINFPY